MTVALYDSLLACKNQGQTLHFEAISNVELAELTEVESVSHDDVAKLFGVSTAAVDGKRAAFGLTEEQRFDTFIDLIWQFQAMSSLYFAELDESQLTVLRKLEYELNEYVRRHGFVPSLVSVLDELPYTKSLLEQYRNNG
ncbi:hypothetical protein JZ785_01605 [Alicyclobacillus curvatus]|jgi:hypothetical protein|nr:hypothetical protein JZ785_01605 [Alicyclobacillus curvatus]